MKAKTFLKGNGITLLVMGIGIAFIAAGLWREEFAIVLEKAINICLECVGIG